MTPSQLKASGRHAIAAQVQHASDQGVEAFAWLPENQSLDTLIEYAVAQSADTIIVPHELADATFVSRLRSRTLERMKRNADVALLIVSADGSVET